MFPIYRVAGDPFELGRQHGEQAREQIHGHLDFINASLDVSTAQRQQRAMQFESMFREFCPHLLEEMQGLAVGAGVPLADALAVNIRSALTSAPIDGGCTAFAISGEGTRDGHILIGQNSDMIPAPMKFGYVLHVRPQDRSESLMWTFGGMIGYHGFNSEGVANFANDLGGGPPPRFGMPHYPVKRMILECHSLDEVTRLLEGVRFWNNGNYVLCDRNEVLDVETTPEGAVPLPLPASLAPRFVAHSNHFLCATHATEANYRQSAKDSFSRLTRMETLIRQKWGDCTLEDCQAMLRDREGSPLAICRSALTEDPAADWVTAGITIASIVAEPHKRRLHVARGNQPNAEFVTYSM